MRRRFDTHECVLALFGLAPKSSMPHGMTYIVQRNDRFYVVAYDGLDPLTGKERRRWHPVGHDRGNLRSPPRLPSG